jgi:hypothetical protein
VDGELDKMLVLFRENFEIKDRGRLGGGHADVQEIDILGAGLFAVMTGGCHGRRTIGTGR